jgi:trigger factor
MDGSTVDTSQGLEMVLVDLESLEQDDEEEAEPHPTPDLHSQVVGMMVNQIKEVPIVYPDVWPANERLQGRTVLYKITLLDLKQRLKPELDDEFAQEVSDLTTMEALRERIRTNLTVEAEDAEFNRQVDAILDQLVEESELSYPSFLIDEEVESRVKSTERSLSMYGITLDDYLRVVEKSREEFDADLRDEAETFVDRSLVLSQYTRDQEIGVDSDEIERELELLLATYDPEAAESVRSHIQEHAEDMQQIIGRLLTRKAILDLHHRVTGEERRPLFAEPENEEAGEGEVDDEEGIVSSAEDGENTSEVLSEEQEQPALSGEES